MKGRPVQRWCGSGATRLRLRPDDVRWRKCASQKRGYMTRAEALDAAEWMMDQDRANPGCHIMPYRCRDCGEWHVANRRIRFRSV